MHCHAPPNLQNRILYWRFSMLVKNTASDTESAVADEKSGIIWVSFGDYLCSLELIRSLILFSEFRDDFHPQAHLIHLRIQGKNIVTLSYSVKPLSYYFSLSLPSSWAFFHSSSTVLSFLPHFPPPFLSSSCFWGKSSLCSPIPLTL